MCCVQWSWRVRKHVRSWWDNIIMEYLTERRNCKGKESSLIFRRAEKCIRVQGSCKGRASSSALPGKLCRLSGCYCSLHLGFQVHLWYHKYRNCPAFFRQNFKVWGCSFVIRIGFTVWLMGPTRETPADVELHALCPASSPQSGKACRGYRELPGGSAGLGCLRKWWQQVFHTPGELIWGFSQFSVNMLTVVLQILSLILCSCFCFSVLLNVCILGGWGVLGFFHLCFSVPYLHFIFFFL